MYLVFLASNVSRSTLDQAGECIYVYCYFIFFIAIESICSAQERLTHPIAKNLLRIDGVSYDLNMSHNKKEIEIPGESTEEAKELELDEQPKPTRKVSHPATPMSNKEEPSTHDKIKGRRTIK